MSPEIDFVFDDKQARWYRRKYNAHTQQFVFDIWMPLGWKLEVETHRRDSGHLSSPAHWESGYTQTVNNTAYTQPSSSIVDKYGRPLDGQSLNHSYPQQGQTSSLPRGQGASIEGPYNTTLGSQPGNLHYEALYPSFYVRNRAFFQEGRVFAIILSENAGVTATSYNTSITEVSFQGHFVHTQKRRFVVVRQRREFCYACPIFTYSNRATTKKGVEPKEHGIVYSVDSIPQYVQGETGIIKPSIGVVMASNPPLQIASRIYYGIHHPIQYNVKVMDIGFVQEQDVPKLIGSWKEENLGETNQDPDVTANAEVPERPQPSEQQHEEADKYLYDETNNRYGYNATISPNCFHPKLNYWGYHVDINPNGYHPDWNPYGYHPDISPDCYHSRENQCGYHPSINPYGYHPKSNPDGHHDKKAPYCFHPKYNQQGYHQSNNSHVYHPKYNPHTWHSHHNQYSYNRKHNPTGHHPDINPYAFHPKHAPYMYHQTANMQGFHTTYNPYGYHPTWNQNGYHNPYNLSGYHPTYNPGAYHPTFNPGGNRPLPSDDGGVGQLINSFQGAGFIN